MVALTIDASDFIKTALAIESAGPVKTRRAVVAAVNRVGDMGFTRVRRKLAETTGIKQSEMNRSKGLAKIPAKPDKLVYKITARSPWTPLVYFNARQRKGGVYARPWAQGRLFGGAFIATMSNGHVGVFRRLPGTTSTKVGKRGKPLKGRERIKEMWGPSLALEMLRPPVPAEFTKAYNENLVPRLNHEVSRALAGLKGGSA
jgi:hypothetical protein